MFEPVKQGLTPERASLRPPAATVQPIPRFARDMTRLGHAAGGDILLAPKRQPGGHTACGWEAAGLCG